ncbi:hypothetical protein ACFC9I_05860 [Enterococcus casseliflavus]|uniref:hypothetical protein n=1 Tax=Enterococcus casseliflavus TaxID=37734 RepID=UPI0039A434CB
MITYVHNVSYDIAEGNSYDELYKFLDSFGDNYGKVTKSSFIIATNLTSFEFATKMNGKLGPNDKIFVSSLAKNSSVWVRSIDSENKIKAILAKNTLN